MGGVGRVLPSGDVCFVFTDVERSTEILRTLGDERWAELQRRMQAIVRDAVERHGGVLVNTEGDGCFAAFDSAPAAIAACSDAQRALSAADWGAVTLRVRMGVHAGSDIRPSGADYVALAVHRAARVCTAAHGGQVLISESALVDGTDVPVVDLGLFSVRDFAGPVRLFAIAGDGPARRTPRVPVAFDPQVPSYVTAMVDREDEIADVIDALLRHRIVTLEGPPGIGKTRVAAAVLAQLGGDDMGGRWFADLTSVQRSSDVGDALARAVGCPPGVSVDSHLETVLDERRGALVLDGCDAIGDAARSAAALLSDWCPSLHILLTARSPLGAGATVEIGPLSLPENSQPAAVMDSASGRLLLERATAVPADLASAHALCLATRGVPLAIELVAAVDVPHSVVGTLAGLVEYAIGTLSAELQRALAALTVPAPPMPARLAAAALRGADAPDDAIDDLVARALVTREGDDAVRVPWAVRDAVAQALSPDLHDAVLAALVDECLSATADHRAPLATFEPVADTVRALVGSTRLAAEPRQRLAAHLAPWWYGRLGPARARELLTEALLLGDTGPATAALHLAIAAIPDTDLRDAERHLRDAARTLGSLDAVDPELVERLQRTTDAARRDEA